MPRTLRLMEETDLPQVAMVVSETFAPRVATCGINWQHDDERLILLVETDIPASEIGEVYRKAVAPLLGSLENEFGEFVLELRSLCACGAVATPMIYGDKPEHDMCLCGECLEREVVGQSDGSQYICPVCELGFYDSGWNVSCSAYISDNQGRLEMDIDTMCKDYSYCSRGCALKRFQAWLSEVESHPIAKEAVS